MQCTKCEKHFQAMLEKAHELVVNENIILQTLGQYAPVRPSSIRRPVSTSAGCVTALVRRSHSLPVSDRFPTYFDGGALIGRQFEQVSLDAYLTFWADDLRS